MGYHCYYLLLIYGLFGVSLAFSGVTHAIESDFGGQLSGWTIQYKNQDEWENNTGLRYIPFLTLTHPLDEDTFFDTELSINSYLATDENSDGEHGDIDIYRLWIRYGSPQLEIRAGLQKINFGSAILLRPLMWFDRIDPRDPLQLTEGVYGLLGRYYFLNNANVWIWALLGEDETKGWEIFPLKKIAWNLEAGCRYPYSMEKLLSPIIIEKWIRRIRFIQVFYPRRAAFLKTDLGWMASGIWGSDCGLKAL